MPTHDPTNVGYPLSSTVGISGGTIENLLIDNSNAVHTIAIVNGRLDEDNTAGSLSVRPEHLQRGAWVRLLSSSSTQDLDYFGDAFRSGVTSNLEPNDLSQSIPGASRRFYMPWSGDVLLLWTVFWTNANPYTDTTGPDTNNRNAVIMTFDGSFIPQTRRLIFATVEDDSPYEHCGYRKSRHYSGFWLQESVSTGWHDASLKMFCINTPHTKVWARNLVVVPLKTTPKN